MPARRQMPRLVWEGERTIQAVLTDRSATRSTPSQSGMFVTCRGATRAAKQGPPLAPAHRVRMRRIPQIHLRR